MFGGIFDNYSSTETLGHKEEFKPLIIKLGVERAIDILRKDFESKGYQDISCNKDFGDICATNGKFDISFQITPNSDSGKATINVSVYKDQGKGGTRKMLKAVIADAKELFKIYF